MANSLHYKYKKRLFILCAFAGFIAGLEFCGRMYLGLGNPLVYRNDFEAGILFEPDQKNIRRGKKATINKNGFRRTSDISLEKKNVKRIFILGDSVAYGGTAVNDEECVSAMLENIFEKENRTQRVEVINAGVNGHQIMNMMGYFSNHIRLFKPDYVILLLTSTKLYRQGLTRVDRNFWEHKPFFALEEALHLAAMSTRYSYRYEELFYKKKYVYIDGVRALLTEEITSNPSYVHGQWWNLPLIVPEKMEIKMRQKALDDPGRHTIALLLLFNKMCRDAGCSLIPVFHPYKSELIQPELIQFPVAVLDFFTDLSGVPWYSLRAALAPHNPKEIYFDSVHLTAAGHAAAAREIYRILKTDGVKGFRNGKAERRVASGLPLCYRKQTLQVSSDGAGTVVCLSGDDIQAFGMLESELCGVRELFYACLYFKFCHKLFFLHNAPNQT